MGLWEKAAAEFIDIIEWTDDSSDTLVWRFPRYENEIKYGAQLVVRQSQAAVFVNRGEIADIFSPGQYSLTTKNLPILTTLLGWAYGFHSPFKAEVYFVNLRNFTNLKWGTRNPVMIRDAELGAVRLRSYGTYVMKIAEPERFIREIVGTSPHFTVSEVSEQLTNLIVTRFADMIAGSGIPIFDLAASYDELSKFLTAKIAPEFMEYGIEVTKLLVENIALPPEVEAALDKKSSMGIIGNLDNYLKFQNANALTLAAANPGGDAASGVGMGMGFAMANQLAKMTAPSPVPDSVPPPLPAKEDCPLYYIGINGTQTGPFDKTVILTAIKDGRVQGDTLLWRSGLSEWEKAENLPELTALFQTPPPLPRQ